MPIFSGMQPIFSGMQPIFSDMQLIIFGLFSMNIYLDTYIFGLKNFKLISKRILHVSFLRCKMGVVCKRDVAYHLHTSSKLKEGV